MFRQATLEQPTVSVTASFMRWLVLLVMALDLISAPLHAHAHDMGPGQFLAHSHADDGGHDDLLDAVTHAEAVDHAMGHSSAAIRSAEQEPVFTPDLATIVAHVAALRSRDPALIEEGRAWRVAADHIRMPSRCTWRPEGRAPPVLHG